MTARADLTAALVRMAAEGRRLPCSTDPGAWTSDDADARAVAAKTCAGCEVIQLCGLTADEERHKFGVWGGRDRTRTGGRPKTSRKEPA